MNTMRDALTFLEAIYGPFDASSGYSKSEVDAAEARCEARLPAALRELYLRTGRVEALHRSHNRLSPPIELGFAGDHLAFYEENQAVVVWAIAREHLGEPNPPVDQGQRTEPDTWTYYPEAASVSQFACAQGAWQAVKGGLPFVGGLDVTDGPLSVEEKLGAPTFASETIRAWLVDGGVATEAEGGHVGLATRTEDAFVAASARLGLEVDDWDYATVVDG